MPGPWRVSHAALTTSQAGALCGVSGNTVRKWCNLGLLSCWRLPQGQRRVRYAELRRFCLEMGLLLEVK